MPLFMTVYKSVFKFKSNFQVIYFCYVLFAPHGCCGNVNILNVWYLKNGKHFWWMEFLLTFKTNTHSLFFSKDTYWYGDHIKVLAEEPWMYHAILSFNWRDESYGMVHEWLKCICQNVCLRYLRNTFYWIITTFYANIAWTYSWIPWIIYHGKSHFFISGNLRRFVGENKCKLFNRWIYFPCDYVHLKILDCIEKC